MGLIDITPVLSDRTHVYPGDNPPTREVLWRLEDGQPVTLSTLRTSVHVGAHADAPAHYGLGGRTMEQQPIDLYVGPCAVVRANGPRGGRLGLEHILGELPRTERLLIHGGTFDGFDEWNDDYCGLAPELVDHLHERGVRLVGVDAPSVDTQDSKELPAHARFFANDMSIIEGLALADVTPGEYELIALPLALEGFDGSPVRAILRELDD
ncbi:MAG TPA: kynurenine formamidase [Phycisphaerales bacterium]|nr:kynurenine formamidase [Phycisphaerales bacterium]